MKAARVDLTGTDGAARRGTGFQPDGTDPPGAGPPFSRTSRCPKYAERVLWKSALTFALIEDPFPAPFCPILRVLDQRNPTEAGQGGTGAERPGSS